MFEVAEVFMVQLIDFMPSLIGLYVLFDFIGMLIPGGSRNG